MSLNEKLMPGFEADGKVEQGHSPRSHKMLPLQGATAVAIQHPWDLLESAMLLGRGILFLDGIWHPQGVHRNFHSGAGPASCSAQTLVQEQL